MMVRLLWQLDLMFMLFFVRLLLYVLEDRPQG
jgi:hypothetical protein